MHCGNLSATIHQPINSPHTLASSASCIAASQSHQPNTSIGRSRIKSKPSHPPNDTDEKEKDLAAYLATDPPLYSPPDDTRIGKSINWSLVILSITRPTSKPPALEVLDFFEMLMEDRYLSFKMSSESMKAAFYDPDIRLRFVNLMCEFGGL